MPEYRIGEVVLDVPRDAVLIDTNVLVERFYPGADEERREVAQFILEEAERQPLIPTAVVIETWGWLVGSRKAFDAGYELLTWLNNPGRATIVPPHRPDVQGTQELIRRLRVDCVDAMLAELATDISDRCDLKPWVPIATFDTKDFTRMTRALGMRLSILDLRTLEEFQIG